jgi:hypothetical protein
MALIIDYVTVPVMKTYIGIDANTKYDALLGEAISSASRDIDNRTGRTFGKDDAPTTRTFVAGKCILFVDDIADASSITVTDSNGNELTDLRMLPLNGVVNGQPGWPTTRMKSSSFCKGEEYTVEAIYGWDEVPTVVEEACKILAAETFLTKDVPHGVKGIDEFGVVRIRESAQIEKKLRPVTIHPVSIR